MIICVFSVFLMVEAPKTRIDPSIISYIGNSGSKEVGDGPGVPKFCIIYLEGVGDPTKWIFWIRQW